MVRTDDLPAAPLPERRRGPKARGISHEGRTLTAWQWSMVTGIPEDTIRIRLKRGWSPERLFAPVEHSHKPQTKKEVAARVRGLVDRLKEIEALCRRLTTARDQLGSGADVERIVSLIGFKIGTLATEHGSIRKKLMKITEPHVNK